MSDRSTEQNSKIAEALVPKKNLALAEPDPMADPQTATPSSNAASRNQLALVRTDLANERTLLAYGRTAIMLAATAVTIVKFFPDLPNVMAYGLAIAGVAFSVALTGVLRYFGLRRRIRS